MDPNNLNRSQNVNDFDPSSLMNHPQFSQFFQMYGGNFPNFPNIPPQQPPPEETTPPTNQNFNQSPQVYQGSNSQFISDEEETVPETPQYPLERNKPISVATNTRDWSVKEDEALIEAYFNNCTDAIIGKDRKFADLWRDIHREYHAAHLSRPHEIPERNKNMLETHWRRMAADLLIWASVMEEAGKITGSGYNDSDVVKNAHELFRRSCQNSPRNFKFQYAWGKVNEYPKWRKFMRWGLNKEERKKVDAEHKAEKEVEESSGSGKRTRDDASSCFVSGGISRAVGVKKAKARRKGKGVASEDLTVVSEQMKVYNEKRDVEVTLKQKKFYFDMQKEMRKQRQLELEEKNIQIQQEKMEADKVNRKFDTLQLLLSKTSLSEMEEKFKQKLLEELYG